MNIRKTKQALLIAVLALAMTLTLLLAACGGGQSDQGDSGSESQSSGQEQATTGDTPEEKVARYIEGYDQISEENVLNNPDPFTYERVCSILGDEGRWVQYVSDEGWIPFEGTPVPGEDAELEYTVEGMNGAIIVSWNMGKNYETENFTSISNTFERS